MADYGTGLVTDLVSWLKATDAAAVAIYMSKRLLFSTPGARQVLLVMKSLTTTTWIMLAFPPFSGLRLSLNVALYIPLSVLLII